jgi:flavin-dependent dehydrogenase
VTFDIAVIGGGPGGSATAIAAARAGLNVVLCETGSYGRD